MPKTTFPFLCFLFFMPAIQAQDAFFTHFYNNESSYNPALVGYRGAFSFAAKYKSQWAAAGIPAYQSGVASLEESLPCSIFDYGLTAAFDEEGQGILRTYEFGGKLAGVVPLDIGKSQHNFRIGLGLNWSFKTIDYNRLIFSDQLDPKYGNIDPTGFIIPNDGRSLCFFTPSIGATHRILLNTKNRRSPTIHYGAAIHNAYSMFKGSETGQEESILNIGTRIPSRYTFFGAIEFIPYWDINNSLFISLRPLVLYQSQGGLAYWEAGTRISVNRLIAFGIYAHFNEAPPEGQNTSWLTLNLELGEVVAKNNRIDIGLAYSSNFSGLRNQFGPTLEVSIAYHFGKSPSCGIAGLDNDLANKAMECPTSAQTPWRRKMYEGIWYRTINK